MRLFCVTVTNDHCCLLFVVLFYYIDHWLRLLFLLHTDTIKWQWVVMQTMTMVVVVVVVATVP